MAKNSDDLIQNLVDSHHKVRVIRSPFFRAFVYTAVILLSLFALMSLRGSTRANIFSQLLSNPRFALELIFALCFYFLSLFLLFKWSMPGDSPKTFQRRLFSFLGLGLLLTLFLFFYEGEAAHGKMRVHCNAEILTYSLLLIPVYIYGLRQAAPRLNHFHLHLLGLSTGITPALLMQIFCTYSASHSVFAHYLPALLSALIAPVLIKILKIRIS